MGKFRILSCILVLTLAATSWSAVRTVAKSGTPDFGTVQAAIDFFTNTDPDPGVADTIQITDASVYDEIITITCAVTIEGNAASRPTLAVQNSTGSDGLNISIATGSTNIVVLKNLLIIPSATVPVVDDIIASVGQNLNMTFDNIVVAPNNGSNAPVSLTGLSEVSLDPPVVRIGDDGMFLGGTAAPVGDGVVITMKNTVITHCQNASSNDGIVLSATGANTICTVQEGCVFSYCARLGIQANRDFVIDAPNNNRVLVLGNKGFAGLWFAGTSPTIRECKGVNVLNNGNSPTSGWGIEQQNGGTVPFLLQDAILAGNTAHGLSVGSVGVSGAVNLNRVTIANNGAEAILTDAALAVPVTVTSSIVGGAAGVGQIVHNGTVAMDLVNTALVLNGPFSLLAPGISGTGTVNQTAVINGDPQFVETANLSSASFYDVQNTAFATAGAGSTPLGGGGDYVGGASVADWTVY